MLFIKKAALLCSILNMKKWLCNMCFFVFILYFIMGILPKMGRGGGGGVGFGKKVLRNVSILLHSMQLYASKGQIFVTLVVSSQIYLPEDEFMANIWCDTTVGQLWHMFQKIDCDGSCYFWKNRTITLFQKQLQGTLFERK